MSAMPVMSTMPTLYTKSQLKKMNSDPTLGINWIKNIETIKENEEAKIYATMNCSLSGRFYIALPATTQLTPSLRTKYNLF